MRTRYAAAVMAMVLGSMALVHGGFNFGVTGAVRSQVRELKKKLPEPPPPQPDGYLAGYVRDAVQRTALSGVSVKVYLGEQLVAQAQTASNGTFAVAVKPDRGYRVNFSRTGYLPLNYYNLSVAASKVTHLQTVSQVAAGSGGPGTAGGTVTDALTGTGIPGLVVVIREGVNATSGTILGTTVTDSSGSFVFDNLPGGYYTAQVTGTSGETEYIGIYITVICVGGATTITAPETVSPVLGPDQWRVVLTWGDTPTDLDAHITGPLPGSSSRFHVYFADRGSADSPPRTVLDRDDTTSYGPETITIHQQSAGVYRYGVHDYTNRASSPSLALSNSGARVSVYKGATLRAVFDVPANTGGTFWRVFDLEGDVITPVNTMSYETVPFQSETGAGVIAGSVRDAVTGTGVAGANISVYSASGLLLASAVTNSSGAYTVNVPAGTGYYAVFARTGYLTATYRNIDVPVNTTVYLQALAFLDDAHASTPGSISGRVTNALTGNGLPGVSVSIRSGYNVTSGTVIGTTTTDGAGDYSFTGLTPGYYTIQISGTGYTTTWVSVIVIGGQTTPNQNASVTPVLAAGQTRIVLTWGETPRDLDSHITFPDLNNPGQRAHVYYSNKLYQYGGTTYVELDVDDTSSYGPETTTIYVQTSGMYRFSVHDYTNASYNPSTALANSQAVVKVYQGSGLVATFNVPNQPGTLWRVFELNGSVITPVNQMLYESSASNISSFSAVPSYEKPDSAALRRERDVETRLFNELPVK
jgi:uncharacterized protein YfaP (DUF2135 family)